MVYEVFNLLIPSAILVPEALRDAGKLPAIVYPLGDGTVLQRLLPCFPKPMRTTIVAYEAADEIERRVKPMDDDSIEIVVLDKLGDLCDTVRFGLSHVDPCHPVVINFSDTVAHGDICADGNADSFYASWERFSSEWSFFDEEEGRLSVSYDRSFAANDAEGMGWAFVGVFRFDSPRDLVACIDSLVDDTDRGVSRFYRALELYSERHPVKPLYPDDWLDIGHREGYVNAQLEVKSRQFNHITIDCERAILRKSSDNVDKFLGEVRWYLKLPANVSYAAPRIFDYSLSYDDPWIKMEYYPYHTLNSLWLDGGLDRATWARVFDKLAFLLGDFARYRVQDAPTKVSEALKDMYLEKTIRRLMRLRGNPHFSAFFERNIVINGAVYPSLDEIKSILCQEVPSKLCNGDAKICLIHGDLCFANIMVDGSYSFVKVVDPRGKFGPYDIYGDGRYELAKLAHSVDGKYDLIIKDRFSASWSVESASIDYKVETPDGPDLYILMKECLAGCIGEHLPEIEFIESLLFLSMVPLHAESTAHQMAMLATGLDLLDRSIGIRIA